MCIRALAINSIYKKILDEDKEADNVDSAYLVLMRELGANWACYSDTLTHCSLILKNHQRYGDFLGTANM